MMACQNCHNTQTVKNGLVRAKPSYQCQRCGDNCVRGDERHAHTTEVKKAFRMILSSLGKASCGFLAKRFGVSRTTTDDWMRHAASILDAPTLDSASQEIEWAEMWQFIQATQAQSGVFKPWIVAQGARWPGCAVVVMRQHANGSPINSTM